MLCSYGLYGLRCYTLLLLGLVTQCFVVGFASEMWVLELMEMVFLYFGFQIVCIAFGYFFNSWICMVLDVCRFV